MATTPNGSSTPSGREQLARLQQEQSRRARRRKTAIIAGGAAAAIAIAGLGGYLVTRGSDSHGKTVDGIANMKTWSGLGRNHVEGNPTYAMSPPVGGDHNAAWANCGIYDKEIPNKYAVHSLEHGAVWITTTSKVSSGDLAKLKKLANQDYVLMSRYEKQSAPIVVSAWEHQITATSASDPRITKFLQTYVQGPQTPEPGAACSGAYDPNTGAIGGHM